MTSGQTFIQWGEGTGGSCPSNILASPSPPPPKGEKAKKKEKGKKEKGEKKKREGGESGRVRDKGVDKYYDM